MTTTLFPICKEAQPAEYYHLTSDQVSALHPGLTLSGTSDYLTLNTDTQILTLGTIDISDDTNLTVSGNLLALTGASRDVLTIKEGTMVSGRLCTYIASGQLECNTESGTVGHPSVTLTGQNYLTIDGSQQITVSQINLGSTHVTGTLAVANGGTGLGTTPTQGQLLIGNAGGGYILATLTAGAGIAVTSGDESITITASGLTSGTGTQNYLSKWLNGTTLTNSLLYDNGTSLGIGRTNLTGLFEVGIGATTPLFVSTGGNVGIGTTDPQNLFQVTAGSNSVYVNSSANLVGMNNILMNSGSIGWPGHGTTGHFIYELYFVVIVDQEVNKDAGSKRE